MWSAKIFVIAAWAILALGCTPTENDNDPARAIVGTWASADLYPAPSYNEKTYFADGTTCGFMLDSPMAGQSSELIVFRGRWRINKGQLVSVVGKSNAGFLTPGEEIVDDVISISQDSMVLRDIESKDVYTRHRVMEQRGDTLCGVYARFVDVPSGT